MQRVDDCRAVRITSSAVLWRSAACWHSRSATTRASSRFAKKGTEFFDGVDMIPIPRFDRPRHVEQEEVDVVFAKFSRLVGRRAAG